MTSSDIEVIAGRKSFRQLTELLARNGIGLTQGDCVRVYDLSCLGLSTPMLIRVVTKMLQAGITFEIWMIKLIITPQNDDKLLVMLEALDGHYRGVHGIKTHPAKMAQQGRKRILDPERLAEVRAALIRPGATATTVAQEFGVARSTLFNYLEKYDPQRRTSDKKS